MDDELQHLEAELKRLQPAAPSTRLLRGIERELERPSAAAENAARLDPQRWWFAALPIAAAIAIASLLRTGDVPKSESQPIDPPAPDERTAEAFKPITAENVLYSATDEGIVTLEDGTPARRARLHYVDTFTWRNPRTNASLTWTVPREEVRIVPVVFQ